jgi:hypothetical protein
MADVVKMKEHRLSYAWYVKYDTNAYAAGPFRYRDPVSAVEAVQSAVACFGELPHELWPEGSTIETEEYEYELASPSDSEDCL